MAWWATMVRKALLPVLLLLAAIPAFADSIHGQPVPLDEEQRSRTVVGSLEFRGGLALTSPNKAFGGLSALRLGSSGADVFAVGDKGSAVHFLLQHDAKGQLKGAADLELITLTDAAGEALNRPDADAEGLGKSGDGWVISFEQNHRLEAFSADFKTLRGPIVAPEGITRLASNGGLETLLDLPDGQFLLLAEDELNPGLHQGWIGRENSWQAFSYQTLEPFQPVDAARLPDGGIVVLERRYSVMTGVGSRIVRLTAADMRKAMRGEPIQGEELARLEAPLTVDNFEGIASRTGEDGKTSLYLLSDDNFSRTQRTLLFQFTLIAR
jgi:hypothetical protein